MDLVNFLWLLFWKIERHCLKASQISLCKLYCVMMRLFSFIFKTALNNELATRIHRNNFHDLVVNFSSLYSIQRYEVSAFDWFVWNEKAVINLKKMPQIQKVSLPTTHRISFVFLIADSTVLRQYVQFNLPLAYFCMPIFIKM